MSQVWENTAQGSPTLVCKTRFSVLLQLNDVNKPSHPTVDIPNVPESPPIAQAYLKQVETLRQDEQNPVNDSSGAPVQSISSSSDSGTVSSMSDSSSSSSEPPNIVETIPLVQTSQVRAAPPPAPKPTPASATPAPAAASSTAVKSAPASAVTQPAKTPPQIPAASSSLNTVPSPVDNEDVDYKSTAYARSRALHVRPSPKVELPVLDQPTRQRIAVERAGELVRVINAREKNLEAIRLELAEARHKLSDAQMATRPAYDVRYEVNEAARVPFAQICIMAIISGALLQLLV